MRRALFILLCFAILPGFVFIGGKPPAGGGGSKTISNVTFYVVMRSTSSGDPARIRVQVDAGTASVTSDNSLTTSYATYSYSMDEHPGGGSWVLSDWTTGSGVQFGAMTRAISGEVRVTQEWCVITYSDTSTETLRPTGQAGTSGWSSTEATHWEAVDETSSDGDSTYLSSTSQYSYQEVTTGDPSF